MSKRRISPWFHFFLLSAIFFKLLQMLRFMQCLYYYLFNTISHSSGCKTNQFLPAHLLRFYLENQSFFYQTPKSERTTFNTIGVSCSPDASTLSSFLMPLHLCLSWSPSCSLLMFYFHGCPTLTLMKLLPSVRFLSFLIPLHLGMFFALLM